jgi:bacteriocin-type transport-associated protein
MKKVLYLLAELDDDDLDWLLATSDRRQVAAGTVLIYEGRTIDTLYFLLNGELSVSTAATGNREIASLSSGEIVGEMSFVDTRPPSATVTAKNRSLLLAISRSALAQKLQQDVGFASRFYRALAVFLSNRLRITLNQLGNGSPSQMFAELSEDELIKDTEHLSLAQTRLDWLLRRLQESE